MFDSILKKKDIRDENPWVRVDRKTWKVIQIGNFDYINKSKVDGHTMTLSIYNQILEERYDKKTIDQIVHNELPN